MSVPEVIYARIAADGTAGPLVQNQGDNAVPYRIFPVGGVPQSSKGAAPRVCYQVISEQEVFNFGGPSYLAEARVQLDCYGNTWAQARALAAAVRNNLNGLKATVTWADNAHTTVVQHCFKDDARDELEEPEAGQATALPRVILDFLIMYETG